MQLLCRQSLLRVCLSLVIILLASVALSLRAQTPAAPAAPERQGLEGLKEIPFAALSSQAVGVLGQAALSLRPTEWKHAETENFIYHYFHSHIATPVSVEAEFYYRVIAKDLGKDTSHWERKAHIFVFESADDWSQFQTKAHLDPWTGGIHARNELFITRDPAQKFKGNALGHETAHLVVNRFYGDNVPLWLNEGYAEYISLVSYATFYRARGYQARPHFHNLPATDFLPLKQLTEMVTYPTEVRQVVAFYSESEVLVRFLSGEDKAKFAQFLDLLSKGSTFDTALRVTFGNRFPLAANFENEFKSYANSALLRKD